MPFSGKAVYSPLVFSSELAEDVSPLVSIISTFETPLLDALGDAQFPAANALHEWVEDALAPNTIVNSTAVASTAADTALGIAGGNAPYLRPGAILRVPGDQVGRTDDGEYWQIKTVVGDTITVARAFGGTTASSFAAGFTLEVISDAALEGDDVNLDTSRGRPRKSNYLQIIKKDVIVSGSLEAYKRVGGITSEVDYQEQQRLREALRDLEKVAIKGILSGNTVGSSSQYRTMQGILRFLTTNAVSIAAATFTESILNSTIKKGWDQGARDMDILVCDAEYKRQIDLLNASRVRTDNNDNAVRNQVTTYESAFGVQRVILSPWPPKNTVIVLSSGRCKVVPAVGRTFSSQPISPTGDASKRMIVGEYTVELKNEEGCAVLRGR